jgi:hypothetical protein
MDQLKQYWEIVKRQHFWILCGLAVLVPFIVSMVADGHLAKIYGDQKSAITGIDRALDPLVSAADHPNPEWVKHVKDETEKLRRNVRDAWESLYNQQKAALKWPPELQEDFISAFGKPVESDDAANIDHAVMDPLCDRFMNNVKTELSHMADIVHAPWAPTEQAGGGGGAGVHGRPRAAATVDSEEAAKSYIVDWDPADQSRLVEAYNWQSTPSPLDVRYAQEELWVLEAICKSIDRTNVGATGGFDAVVREINNVLIGYDATDKFPLGENASRIIRSSKSGPGAASASPPMGMPGGPGGAAAAAFEPKRPMRSTPGEAAPSVRSRTSHGGAFTPPGGGAFTPPGGGAAPGPGGPAAQGDWLKDGRYVDSKGKPLLGSELANSTSPEFKLMAFKLTVAADEQRWQKLLVELCNSPLPLEVREVRINPNDSEGGGGRPNARARMAHDQNGNDSILHNVTLEIHGVAYLINPPDMAKLGITAAGAPPTGAAPAASAPATSAPATATTPPAVPPTTAPPVAPPVTSPPTTTPPAVAPAAK